MKAKLLGGEFRTDDHFVNKVSKFGDETSISKYVHDQGLEKENTVLPSSKQLVLFQDIPLLCGWVVHFCKDKMEILEKIVNYERLMKCLTEYFKTR